MFLIHFVTEDHLIFTTFRVYHMLPNNASTFFINLLTCIIAHLGTAICNIISYRRTLALREKRNATRLENTSPRGDVFQDLLVGNYVTYCLYNSHNIIYKQVNFVQFSKCIILASQTNNIADTIN